MIAGKFVCAMSFSNHKNLALINNGAIKGGCGADESCEVVAADVSRLTLSSVARRTFFIILQV